MIDPSILLQGRNPQIETPLDAQTQAAQLRNLGNVGQIQQGQIAMQPGELQAQQLQIQQAQMQNQQMQQAIKDQAAMRQAYVDANGDPAQTRANAIKNGVSMNGLQAFDQQVTARQTALEKLKSDQLADHLSQTDQLHTLFAPIAGIADPAQQGQAWNDALRQSVNAKLMTPDEAAKHPYPGSADAVNLYVAQLSSDKAITANAAQMRAQAQATDAANNTTKTNLAVKADKLQELSHALSVNDPVAYAQAYGAASADPFVKANPDVLARYDAPAQFNPQTSPLKAQRAAMTEEQIAQADQAAANASEAKTRDTQTAAHQNATLGVEQAKLRLAQQAAAGGPDPLAGRSGADLERLRAIAAGAIPPVPARSKNYAADMDALLTIDPTYTEARYDTIKNFKEKGDANNLVTMTTALAHLDRALGNSAALGTSPTQALNITPSQHRYSADVDLLTGEIGKLVKAGVVSEGESNRLTGNLKSAFQSNRDAALDELKDLMAGKVEALVQKYKAGTGRDIPRSMFDAATQARMAKYGIGAGDAGAPAAQPVAPVTPVPPHVQALRNKYNY